MRHFQPFLWLLHFYHLLCSFMLLFIQYYTNQICIYSYAVYQIIFLNLKSEEVMRVDNLFTLIYNTDCIESARCLFQISREIFSACRWLHIFNPRFTIQFFDDVFNFGCTRFIINHWIITFYIFQFVFCAMGGSNTIDYTFHQFRHLQFLIIPEPPDCTGYLYLI